MSLVLAQVDGRGVEPQDGGIALVDEAVGHLGRRAHLSLVEVVRAELHDLVVHAVLHLQQRDTLGLVLDDAFHEGRAQTALQSLKALDGGRQLAVVTSEDDAAGAADGYPAGRLERLGRLVDKEGAEFLAVEQFVSRTHQR